MANKKIIFMSLSLTLGVHSAAFAGIDANHATELLRSKFTDAGLVLNIDTPSLKGTTPTGDACSVDLSLVGEIGSEHSNSVQIALSVGPTEVNFDISPELPSFEIRQRKSPDNVLSLSAMEDQQGGVILILGQPEFSHRTLHRSIQITSDDDKKIVSVYMKDESGEATCNLN